MQRVFPQEASPLERNRGRRPSCADDDRMPWTGWRSPRIRLSALLVRIFPLLTKGGADSLAGSVHRRPTAAFLVFLSRAAGARIVPPDLRSAVPWLTPVGTCTDPPLRPEVPIRLQQPSRHVSLDVFPLLRADRLGTHFRVFILLVEKHHHWD